MNRAARPERSRKPHTGWLAPGRAPNLASMTDDVAGGLDEPDELQPEQGALALASPQDDWSRTDWEKAAAAVLRKSGMLSDDDPDDTV